MGNQQSFGASIRISQPPVNQEEMGGDFGEHTSEGYSPKQCDDCLKCQFQPFKIRKILDIDSLFPLWFVIMKKVKVLSQALQDKQV